MVVQPTEMDKVIANAIARHTTPALEQAARLLTWGADEKVVLALASGGWLYGVRRPALRPVTNHLLAVSVLAAVLPHLLKREVDQTRPDRLTVRGHWRGIPLSGCAHDSFPSGHAVHMGALVSAAELLPQGPRAVLRGLTVGLSATRVLLLAHWASDVVIGFAAGALMERALRPLTLRSGRRASAGDP